MNRFKGDYLRHAPARTPTSSGIARRGGCPLRVVMDFNARLLRFWEIEMREMNRERAVSISRSVLDAEIAKVH
jgi:hypothetical protein